MLEAPLKPGVYRISELAKQLNVHRCSVDRYIEKLGLEIQEISFQNRLVKGIVLDEEQLQKLLTYVQENKGLSAQSLKDDSPQPKAMSIPPSSTASTPSSSMLEGRTQSQTPLNETAHVITFEEYQALQTRLMESEIARAKVEGEIAGLKEVVDTLRRTNLTLENTLQATLLLEGRRQQDKPIEMVPAQHITDSKGLFSRMKRFMFGSSTNG
jgi:hypothetical protein